MQDKDYSRILLQWYDANAREMPWRVGPKQRAAGMRPDPYKIWLSEIMLQQTTVATVGDYFRRFVARWPTVGDLARAPDSDVMGEWAGLGYYARARNLLKCARIISSEYSGKFPDNHAELLKLPGIGPYTAAAISSIAFDQPETVLDGNVERVMSRLFLVKTPLPKSKPELKTLAARLTPRLRPGDYAQAVMDIGATVCRPKNPTCETCPFSDPCQARRLGVQSDLPRKIPKKPKPTRVGIAYLAQRSDGAWLLERRPDKGLLGGMLGWPGTDWGETATDAPPVTADWHDPGVGIRHTFTHFHLNLEIRIATLPMDTTISNGQFLHIGEFQPSDLPTVMRKAFDLAAKSKLGLEN